MYNGKFKRINMGFNYKLAENIISCFNKENIDDELNCMVYIQAIDSEKVIREILDEGKDCILKPNKYTLLHCFIGQYLYHYLMNERYYLLDQICDDFEADIIIRFIDETAKILNEYGIIVMEYEKKIKIFDEIYEQSDCSLDIEYKELVGKIYDEILEKFNNIEEDIVEATFYLLFNNKGFLFRFHEYLSKYVTVKFLVTNFFDTFNHIKRCSYLPEWLKRAVFYRDNGRCQHCGKDLTGLLAIGSDKELQYDHIIPLERCGTNDATNFQLLCSDCNLKKGGNTCFPDYYYQMYW